MSNILYRIQEIARQEGITIGAFERTIGASKGVLSRAIAKGTDIQSKWIGVIVENYPKYSTRWLLTGEGPMLRADDTLALPATPSTDSPAPSDTVVLRLMEKIDEKDAKIDQLQSDLRQKSEELAALKAKYPEEPADNPAILKTAKPASTKKSSSPNADNAPSANAR